MAQMQQMQQIQMQQQQQAGFSAPPMPGSASGGADDMLKSMLGMQQPPVQRNSAPPAASALPMPSFGAPAAPVAPAAATAFDNTVSVPEDWRKTGSPSSAQSDPDGLSLPPVYATYNINFPVSEVDTQATEK